MTALDTTAAAWWPWISTLAVQAALFTAAVLVLDRVIERVLERRVPPVVRLALWLLAAARFVIPPTLASPVSVAALVADQAPGLSTDHASPATALFLAWLAGVAMAAAMALRARRSVLAEIAAAVPAPSWVGEEGKRAAARLGLRSVARVVVSATTPTAYVCGLFAPVVVLPASAVAARHRDAGHMLLHELAHVKRRDVAIDTVLIALSIVFWFHPAIWLIRRRAADLREICCDATAAAALGPRAGEYRDTLLAAARSLLDAPGGSLRAGPAFFGRTSQIVARLRSLDRRDAGGRAARGQIALATVILAALAALVLPMGSTWSQSDQSLADARRVLASGLSGTSRPGSRRLHLAAMRIAGEEAINRSPREDLR